MIIGLTQRVLFHKGRAYDSIEQGWYSCLRDHKLVFIPNGTIENYDIDMLVVTGGDNHPLRAKTESALIQQMIKENKPIIGVCHGAFLLTELLGGKVGDASHHMDCEHAVYLDNKVEIVNSYHTLQITEAPKGSTVLATDNEGYCESWIYNNIGAVVWHPERMDKPYWPTVIEKLFTKDVL